MHFELCCAKMLCMRTDTSIRVTKTTLKLARDVANITDETLDTLLFRVLYHEYQRVNPAYVKELREARAEYAIKSE